MAAKYGVYRWCAVPYAWSAATTTGKSARGASRTAGQGVSGWGVGRGARTFLEHGADEPAAEPLMPARACAGRGLPLLDERPQKAGPLPREEGTVRSHARARGAEVAREEEAEDEADLRGDEHHGGICGAGTTVRYDAQVTMLSGSLYPNKVSWERPATRGELRAPRQAAVDGGEGKGALYEEDADKGAWR